MIKQLVVAAGGIGSRLNRDLNSYRSKVLIDYKGIPLIFYLLKSAKEAGVREFLISVNEHTKAKIESIANCLDLTYTLALTSKGFRGVPLLFGNDLDDRFIFACGHHPISQEYFIELFKSAPDYAIVSSSYFQPNQHQREILVEGFSEDQLILIDTGKREIGISGYFIESPHLVTKSMAEDIKRNNFDVSWPYIIYQQLYINIG